MEKYKLAVEMTYETRVEIEAESLEDAIAEARDMAGDGKLLKDADITDVEVEELFVP